MDYYTFLREKSSEIERLSQLAAKSDYIDSSMYEKYDVKRGLRDINGNGVVCGLTEISEIVSSKRGENGEKLPCRGELYYRGIRIEDLVSGFYSEKRYGFEETVYLLLFGKLPTASDLSGFEELLAGLRQLPNSFVRDVIMKAPSADMMNGLARSVLTLYSYDDRPDDISIENVLRQVLQLIAQFPLLSVYGYQTYLHYHRDSSLIIHNPESGLSTAENVLHLLRADGKYTELEARILDLCLVLHAEHGGGNNSTFTTHVVTSSGTDTYSAVAASLGSLKGPRHGGANIKVVKMFDDMKATLKDTSDGAVCDYLTSLLEKQGFDRSGLIYGMGHAVYSASDPRTEVLKRFVPRLAEEKGMEAEYELYSKVERLAPQVIAEKRKIYKGVSANIDFYSGFVYSMLNLPVELFTPIFAVARIAGWGAHRMEELSNNGKIIRPGYTSVAPRTEYVRLQDRT